MRPTRPSHHAGRAVLAGLFVLFLPLAACGGDDDSSGDGVTPAETDEGAPVDEDMSGNDDQGDTLGGEAED